MVVHERVAGDRQAVARAHRPQAIAAGRRIRTTNALGNSTTSIFDPASRLIASIDPLLNRTSMVYDASGRQVRTTNALNNSTTSIFDPAGRLLASIDPLLHRTSIDLRRGGSPGSHHERAWQ